jgi:hypothetical protein
MRATSSMLEACMLVHWLIAGAAQQAAMYAWELEAASSRGTLHEARFAAGRLCAQTVAAVLPLSPNGCRCFSDNQMNCPAGHRSNFCSVGSLSMHDSGPRLTQTNRVCNRPADRQFDNLQL